MMGRTSHRYLDAAGLAALVDAVIESGGVLQVGSLTIERRAGSHEDVEARDVHVEVGPPPKRRRTRVTNVPPEPPGRSASRCPYCGDRFWVHGAPTVDVWSGWCSAEGPTPLHVRYTGPSRTGLGPVIHECLNGVPRP